MVTPKRRKPMSRLLLIPMLILVGCDMKPLPTQSQVAKRLKPLEGQTLIVYAEEGEVTMTVGAHISDTCPNAIKAKKKATRRGLVTGKNGQMIGPGGHYEEVAGLCYQGIAD